MTGVIEIGRKSLGCCGLAFFGIGVILAVFHWHGMVPDASDWWKRVTGKWFGKDRCAQSQELRWYLVETGCCWPQRIEHSEHVRL